MGMPLAKYSSGTCGVSRGVSGVWGRKEAGGSRCIIAHVRLGLAGRQCTRSSTPPSTGIETSLCPPTHRHSLQALGRARAAVGLHHAPERLQGRDLALIQHRTCVRPQEGAGSCIALGPQRGIPAPGRSICGGAGPFKQKPPCLLRPPHAAAPPVEVWEDKASRSPPPAPPPQHKGPQPTTCS